MLIFYLISYKGRGVPAPAAAVGSLGLGAGGRPSAAALGQRPTPVVAQPQVLQQYSSLLQKILLFPLALNSSYIVPLMKHHTAWPNIAFSCINAATTPSSCGRPFRLSIRCLPTDQSPFSRQRYR